MSTNEWKLAYRIVFWSFVGALMMILMIVEFLPPGDERNVLRTIGISIGAAAMVVMLVHTLKPEWFRSKVQHHPDEEY